MLLIYPFIIRLPETKNGLQGHMAQEKKKQSKNWSSYKVQLVELNVHTTHHSKKKKKNVHNSNHLCTICFRHFYVVFVSTRLKYTTLLSIIRMLSLWPKLLRFLNSFYNCSPVFSDSWPSETPNFNMSQKRKKTNIYIYMCMYC